MKERPILFSAPMVRAVLEGRKTQTRRIMKEPIVKVPYGHESGAAWLPGVKQKHGNGHWIFPNALENIIADWCPYGQSGDRLWVRETFRVARNGALDEAGGYEMLYHATDGYPDVGPWKPSIHMPRWASRIELEITGVRVERLQDICEDDAKSEGAAYHDGGKIGHSGWRHDLKDVHTTAKSSFKRLWQSINGPESWDANPWVWVIEFTVLKPETGQKT